jgi:hypothetical protein
VRGPLTPAELAAVHLRAERDDLRNLTKHAENRRRKGLPISPEMLAELALRRENVARRERGEEIAVAAPTTIPESTP